MYKNDISLDELRIYLGHKGMIFLDIPTTYDPVGASRVIYGGKKLGVIGKQISWFQFKVLFVENSIHNYPKFENFMNEILTAIETKKTQEIFRISLRKCGFKRRIFSVIIGVVH